MAGRDSASLLRAGFLLVLFHTWGAWAAVEVAMDDKVEVYLGNTVNINCKFTSDDGSGGTSVQWFYVSPSEERQRIFFHDSIVTTIDKGTPYTDRILDITRTSGGKVLTISDVQLQDERVFICVVRSLTEGAGEGNTTLRVFASPNRPTIEGPPAGISVSEMSKIGSCEVKNGYPKPNITWYRNSTPLSNIRQEVEVKSRTTKESSGLYSVVSELTMKVKKDDKDAQFYCEVIYYVPKGDMMTETSRINITVYYPATAVNIWVESPKGKIKEGDSIELHCRANGNMPSIFTIKRVKDGESVDGSTLILKDVTRDMSGDYECLHMDTESFQELSNTTSVFVNYLDKAAIGPKNTIVVQEKKEVKATCNAPSSLPTHTAWLKDGKKVSTERTLILKHATYDMAGQYMCVVSIPEIEGMETSNTLHVRVQGSPEIMEGDAPEKEVEVVVEETVDLKCSVRGDPVPTITWSSPDGKSFEGKFEKTEQGAESTVSVKVSSDMTLRCNATNGYGGDVKTFSIRAVAPIYTTTPATTTTTTATTTTTTTTNTTTTTTTISKNTETSNAKDYAGEKKAESNGVIIAVIIIIILLLAVLGSVLYFLYKKGKICGRSGKQDFNKGKSGKDNVVVEMKSDKTEEAILLGVNGEKQPPGDQ